MNSDDYFLQNIYSIKRDKKHSVLLESLLQLTESHLKQCDEYHRIVHDLLKTDLSVVKRIEDLPFLPVQIFKNLSLKSVAEEEVFKVLTSSGTTGQRVSQIILDRESTKLQTKSLVAVVKEFIGGKRLPMLIVDSPSVIKDRTKFSARGAGIVGFSTFGRKHTYLLDDQMQPNLDVLRDFVEAHKEDTLLIFGFTFMVWKYLVEHCKEQNVNFDLSNAVLIHGGGWKKLTQQNITNQHFKSSLNTQLNVQRIHDYYGMVEQIGSIFMECDAGHLHVPSFADVLIRDPLSFECLPHQKSGLIQVLSVLPRSYPGHNLLTEDLGSILGEDDCECGRLGKYLQIIGRLPKAEVRGCSDTHAFDRGQS